MNEIEHKQEQPCVSLKVPSAKEIKDCLDQYVVGQDDIKKVLSVAVHNHYRRIQLTLDNSLVVGYNDVEIEKSNILMCGPTGCGKTLLAKTLAKMLGVPFAIADATTLTQAGYVGEDVENIVRYLWQNANQVAELTQIGIIYIDEIDKIASMTNNVSLTRDVSGTGVQQALLKIIEGTTCRFPANGGRKHPDQPLVEIDTSNILFICSGAFVGLDNIIADRNAKHSIGFGLESKTNKERVNNNDDIEPEDLIKFGLIPEFVGRLPVLAKMQELTENDLIKIMTEPKNAIVKQYQKLLAMDNIALTIKDDAIAEIAKLSIKRKTGARGLKSIIEKLMRDIMFDAYQYVKTKAISITKKMVVEKFKHK
jgi:ATP-dependent Clp protease ATP-binding subunit ClpX